MVSRAAAHDQIAYCKEWMLSRYHRISWFLWLCLGVWFLTACGTNQLLDQLPENLQMLNTVHTTVLPDNTFAMTIPIYNRSTTSSTPTQLQISFHYTTDSNGGSLVCSAFAPPTECKQPLKCMREVTLPVPSLTANARWDTPAVPISDAQGPCACIKDHCDGIAELRLDVRNPPRPASGERLCNTYLTSSWRVDGSDSGVVGYKNDKRYCYADLP